MAHWKVAAIVMLIELGNTWLRRLMRRPAIALPVLTPINDRGVGLL